MKVWTWMTGGLLIWAVHFMGVYGIASLADVLATADDPFWRAIGLGFSVLCVLAAAVLLGLAVRRLRRPADDGRPFPDQLAALGAGIACVAMVWQALPTVIGY